MAGQAVLGAAGLLAKERLRVQNLVRPGQGSVGGAAHAKGIVFQHAIKTRKYLPRSGIPALAGRSQSLRSPPVHTTSSLRGGWAGDCRGHTVRNEDCPATARASAGGCAYACAVPWLKHTAASQAACETFSEEVVCIALKAGLML